MDEGMVIIMKMDILILDKHLKDFIIIITAIQKFHP